MSQLLAFVGKQQLSECMEAMSAHLTQPEHVTARERRFAAKAMYRKGFFALRRRLK